MDSTLSSHWQDALEPQFVRRVTRPLWQAGLTNSQLANTILGRSDLFYNRLSLLTQQMQRWGHNSTLQLEQIPIVYAQPAYQAMENSSTQPAPSSQLSSLESITTDSSTTDSSLQASSTTDSSSSSSQASASSVPIVTANPVSSQLGTSEAMPLQAKFDSSQASALEGSRQPQPLASPNSRSSTNEIAIPPTQPALSSQLSSLESITTDSSTTDSSSSSSQPTSSTPIVTPNPVSSPLGTSEAMPLQAKFEISSARSQRLSTVENTWITNKLPVVPAQSVVSPTSRIATSNAVNDMLKSDKQERIHSAAISSTPHTAHSATVADPRSLIVKPSPPQTPTITQETSLPENPLPVISAQLIAHSQPMVPLSFSSPTAVGDGKGFSEPISSTQTVIPYPENEFSRTQETIISTTGRASPAYSSPFVETQVNQSSASTQSIDLEAMVAKMERRLLRRLVIESERRGQNRWGLRS